MNLTPRRLRLGDGVPRESVGDGIYDIGRMGSRDRWSDEKHARDMAADQVAAWRAVARGDSGEPVISQWVVTPDAAAATAYTLQGFAIQAANPALYWAGVNGTVLEETIPNSWIGCISGTLSHGNISSTIPMS